MIGPQEALIYTMVLVSASDGDMSDPELRRMGLLTQSMPIFEDFEVEEIGSVAGKCVELLRTESGLDDTIEIIKGALPKRLRDTAYAVACDIGAADGTLAQEELRLLELLRYGLEIDRLTAAAIEKAAAARNARA